MRIVQIPLISAALALAACAASSTQQLPISGQYGTVAYSGTVVREETPDTYVFIVRDLKLTFSPNAGINSVEAITNPTLRLETMYLAPSATQGVPTSEESTTLHLTLDADHPVAHVRDLRFVMNKTKVTASTSTHLDLTDGHTLWPFVSQLKP
ncbi:hypothetical protein [Rhodanobacter sp. C06]|uniref:hypothetical protein n=1 Tax=Rhodanobacter sp. C06 TaxID=1945854 RepID=UPI001115A691|nr:hypothetical protein [Rhodanobacter sp. C06]